MAKSIFKNEKTRKRNLIICLIPFILIICIFGYLGYRSLSSLLNVNAEGGTETEVDDDYTISKYNYHLRENATDYQFQLFQELREALESGDDLKCAEEVAMNFIADFYTWTNKAGSYDVGGAHYLYSKYLMNGVAYARDNFYKYLTYYINKYGSENLIEVTNIRIKESYLSEDKLTIDGVDYNYYYVMCEWDYNDYSFDKKSNYFTRSYFKIIKGESGRFEIAEVYGDE